MNNSAQNTNNGTCLHCNTMRRTTGVHQTTQTGPVSPIPQNISNKTVFLGFSDASDYDKASSSSVPAGLRQVCSFFDFNSLSCHFLGEVQNFRSKYRNDIFH